MPGSLSSFLDPSAPSLKICGVTRIEDAERLADLGVDALGVNFWPSSPRYCPLEDARPLLTAVAGRILRVGVFVNADAALLGELLEEPLIDLAQFHGDETPAWCAAFADSGYPFLKALGISNRSDLSNHTAYRATGLLLDAAAPGVYGGTGHTIDWNLAAGFVRDHPATPVVLAGGLTPANAAEALATVRPSALDVASGAEIEPGIKDFAKVEALLSAARTAP